MEILRKNNPKFLSKIEILFKMEIKKITIMVKIEILVKKSTFVVRDRN